MSGGVTKHKRFSDEQVIGVLKEHEAGAKVDDICRRHAISSATFYTWRKRLRSEQTPAASATPAPEPPPTDAEATHPAPEDFPVRRAISAATVVISLR